LLPLSQTSVLELAHATRHNERIDDLYTVTGGNPFFVTEVLASGDVNVPATVRDAVLARSARLSAAAREVLDVASVVPARIEAGLLKLILSPSASAIEECVECGMLRMDGNSLAFRHELARRTLEDSLSSSRRQALHQKVLGAYNVVKIKCTSRLVHHGHSPEMGRQSCASRLRRPNEQ
jgi:predicted ATPase